MAERTITAFEAAPQGQIGSGLAQVFDTTNLVQAAVAMKQQRQAQFTQLVESLADIDPNLARPQDTPAILAEFNDLYNYVVENYEDISNPMRNPEAAIKMKQKKNELLRAVNASKALGDYQLKLTEEMPKSEYFMDAYAKNAGLIERINSSTVYTTDSDGKRVFNPQAVSLLSEGLQIGKDPNVFAIELADEMEPQFDGNVSYTTIGGVKIFQQTPKTLTEQDLNAVIDASLTGNTANSVAVTNSILGVEAPYDALTDAEKDRVRVTLRPLLAQRLETKGDWKIYTPPSNFGAAEKKEVDVNSRVRNMIDFSVGNPNAVGLVSEVKWADSAGTVQNVQIAPKGNDVVFTVTLKDGNTVSTRDYVYGKIDGDKVLLGAEAGANYEAEFNRMASALNTTLNKAQSGELKAIDFENIRGDFKSLLREETERGLNLNISAGEGFQVGDKTLTRPQLKNVLKGVATSQKTSNGRVTAINRLIVESGFSGDFKVTPSGNNNDGVVMVNVGGTSTTFDLSKSEDLESFTEVLINTVAIPSSRSAQTKMMRLGTTTPFDAANDPVLD